MGAKLSIFAVFKKTPYICAVFAGVLELVDNPDLGSGALRRMGSSPFTRTQAAWHIARRFSFAGEGTPSTSTPCRSATSPYSGGMPEPAALRLQNPGGSTASTCSASLAEVPPRRLMAPVFRCPLNSNRSKTAKNALFHSSAQLKSVKKGLKRTI